MNRLDLTSTINISVFYFFYVYGKSKTHSLTVFRIYINKGQVKLVFAIYLNCFYFDTQTFFSYFIPISYTYRVTELDRSITYYKYLLLI